MVKQLIPKIFLVLFILAFKNPAQKAFQKVLVNDYYNFISINNIKMWISNNGDGSHDPGTDGNGFYWPKDTVIYPVWYPNGYYLKSAIYEDGLIWGGKIQTVAPDTQSIRANGNTHRQGLQAGKILPNGQADDPHNPKYRVYKIRKEWQELPSGSVKDQYQKDYEEWPAEDGAPWIDKDGDNIYTSYVDQPDFIGDEVLWYVANDLDTSRALSTYGSLPLGLEQQVTVWGLNKTAALGNMVFKKYRMINKGLYDIDSMYFSIWSDPDLGGAGDDFVGVDTLTQMAYVYNGDDDDAVYSSPVPAFGYVLLQGALRKSNMQDLAFHNGSWIKGFINTKICSFIPFIKGDPFYDPWNGSYFGTIQTYYLMHSKTSYGHDIVDPNTGQVVNIALTGDPVSGTGWYEGSGWPSGPPAYDRRLLLTHGPFTMARGDTQDVVFAFVIGRYINNIQSISKIRRLATIARNAYYNDFKYPKMPPPKVNYSTLDQKIELYWDDKAENFNVADPYIDKVESRDTTYNFEGYRIWQYRDLEGSDPRLLAVFDVKNSISKIFEYQNINGILGLVPLFISPDEGLRRSFTIDKDIYSGLNLNNGSPYYFAVTAYAYSQESAKRVLESKPVITEVIPQKQNINTTFSLDYQDLIFGEQVAGDGDGQIIAQIIDPEIIKNNHYRLVIDGTEQDTLRWIFLNTDLRDTLAWNQTDFSLDSIAARNYDGFRLMVQNQGRDSLDAILGKDYGAKSVLQVADADGTLDTPRDVIQGVSQDGQWRITTYGTEEVRQNINPPTSDAIGYDNYEIRFTTEEQGSEYYLYGYYATFYGPVTDDIKAKNKVPFQIWNVGRNLESKEDDIRLKVKIRDKFLQPGLELYYVDDSLWTRSANGNWEAIYGYLETDSSYHDYLPDRSGPIERSDIYIHNIFINGELPEPGTVIRIIPWRPLSEGDVFEISTMAPDTMDYSKAKQNLDKITVFPNPYFGSEYRNNQPGQGFVRFGNLPRKATIRIYTIAGQLVNKFEKEDASPWYDWSLDTIDKKKVPSGIYIAHIQMPKIGKKILKIALVQDN